MINEERHKRIAILIERAKKKVEESYGKPDAGRRWVKTHIDSYKDPQYRIELHVWEGSPAKGYIVVNYSEGFDSVRAFGLYNQIVYTGNTYSRFRIPL